MSCTNRSEAIRAYCEVRRIGTVVHFTRLENLAGILADGILPRLALEGREDRVIVNDYTRADGQKDAICLSIGFPNYKMFFKYRRMHPTATWAILQIRSEILWQFDCAFCWANASCSVVRSLPLPLRKDSSSLEKMFADRCEVSGVSRSSCKIPDNYSTNPQAEVLAFSRIPLSYVAAVYFQDENARSKFLPRDKVLTVGVKPDYFDARCDWQLWKQVPETGSGESWQDARSSVPF
jgi:hypothetical protein